MVEGKTKSGLKFQLDERIKDDARFLYFLTVMNDDKLDIMERGSCVIKMLKLIFGTDEGVIDFMNAVAASNNGICDNTVMMAELSEMFEALNAKNSSSLQE